MCPQHRGTTTKRDGSYNFGEGIQMPADLGHGILDTRRSTQSTYRGKGCLNNAKRGKEICSRVVRYYNFLCLVGACGLPPMPLEKFNEVYKKLPDGHKQGGVIRTRIHKYVKDS